MMRVVAGRLERLPLGALREIAYPVSQWMDRVGSRLYAGASLVLPGLWNGLIEALSFGASKRSNRVVAQISWQ
jgi:hypothetical protein